LTKKSQDKLFRKLSLLKIDSLREFIKEKLVWLAGDAPEDQSHYHLPAFVSLLRYKWLFFKPKYELLLKKMFSSILKNDFKGLVKRLSN